MGGEKGVLSLVERFYFYMDTLHEVKELRAIHAPDLSSAKDKLFKFLSGWLGGYPLVTHLLIYFKGKVPLL
jgi:hemoglobin